MLERNIHKKYKATAQMQASVKMFICAACDRFRSHLTFWSLLINIVMRTDWRRRPVVHMLLPPLCCSLVTAQPPVKIQAEAGVRGPRAATLSRCVRPRDKGHESSRPAENAALPFLAVPCRKSPLYGGRLYQVRV